MSFPFICLDCKIKQFFLGWQLYLYYLAISLPFRGDLILKIVKSLKNPRSAVCKTAIMTCSDIFKVYNDSMIDFLDPLVCYLTKLKISYLQVSFQLPSSSKNMLFRVLCYSTNLVNIFITQLVQLLLKSSQDKRFVCEASETALIAMTTWISPSLLLPKLQPYLKNKNPRVRAKASMCFSRSVPRLVSFIPKLVLDFFMINHYFSYLIELILPSHI